MDTRSRLNDRDYPGYIGMMTDDLSTYIEFLYMTDPEWQIILIGIITKFG